MKLHIIMHESFEAPAAIVDWAFEKDHQTAYTHLYKGETLPENVDAFDFLIIMGGPQSPETIIQECPHFNAKEEIIFIKKAIDHKKLVLGICLGAQLIGEALGAKFQKSPNKEIGVFELMLTDDAKHDTAFFDFPNQFLVGHWHSDMPGLTSEAKILASSKACPRQIINYLPGVYGFQCHFEFTLAAIKEMIKHCGNALKKSDSLPYVQSADRLLSHDYTPINKQLFKFLDRIEVSRSDKLVRKNYLLR